MAENQIVITRRDDDYIEVTCNGHFVNNANLDENGWAGMEMLEGTVRTLGKILGIVVKVKDA